MKFQIEKGGSRIILGSSSAGRVYWQWSDHISQEMTVDGIHLWIRSGIVRQYSRHDHVVWLVLGYVDVSCVTRFFTLFSVASPVNVFSILATMCEKDRPKGKILNG
ncbi:hypothetical protein BDR07DRAFT_123193 [Suillus spraguei]|nr:hypothetical protein BDR07DRAFT_123193 [Suillus spraguei]